MDVSGFSSNAAHPLHPAFKRKRQGAAITGFDAMPPALKPLCLCLGLAYSAGAPAFEGVRPQAVDGTLSRFHQDVTLAVGDGLRVARGIATGERAFTLTGMIFADVNRSLRAAR
jgi:hypothetical protein